MKLDTLNELRQALRNKLRELDAISPTCLSCQHFASGRTCDKWQAEPPPEYRTKPGQCTDWEHDRIPF